MLSDGKTLPPVCVVEVDGMFVVRDGNNRVMAYKRLNLTDIPCIIDSLCSNAAQTFRDTLKVRQANNQVGFENIPVVSSSEARAKLIQEEFDEMMLGAAWEGLAKSLPPPRPVRRQSKKG